MAEASPDAKTLEALMATAIGPDNGNYRSTIAMRDDDGYALIEQVRFGVDKRTSITRGKIKLTYGQCGGISWSQDANGVNTTDAPDRAASRTPRLTATVQRQSFPRDAYVLSVLDEDGFGHRDYVDPASYLVIRRDDIDANGTSTTAYGPYRRYGTQLMPSWWHIQGVADRTSATFAQIGFEADVATRDDIAISPERQFVTLPANATSIDLLATTSLADSLITVPVSIGNKRFYFILDSGSSAMAIDSQVADTLGLEEVGHVFVTGSGKSRAREVLVPALDINGLHMHDVIATTLSFGSGSSPSEPAGILGFDFFAHLIVHVDNSLQSVVVSDPRTFTAPTDASLVALPVQLGQRVPFVSISIGGANAKRMVVDTGSEIGVLLFDTFARKHVELFLGATESGASAERAPLSTTKYGFVSGIGGKALVRHDSVPFIQLGNYTINAPNVDVVVARHAFVRDADGLLGRGVLRRFITDFDYAHRLIYLRPAKSVP